MATEETPLLKPCDLHDSVYSRFTPGRKRWIVTLVSFCGLVPLFVSGSFVPSIPQIAHDLNSSGQVISLAVSLSILTNAFGCLLWATYSSFYGRKAVYLASVICQCLGSLGVATSRTVPELLALRILQAFGASSGLSIGIAVIGDIYKLEERGAAAGIFFGAVCLGPALAPLAGGFSSQYYSWRAMQAALLVCGLIMLTLITFFLPETIHPGTRGLDKLSSGKSKWVWLSPSRSLGLLRSPNVFVVALCGGIALVSNFALLVPIAYTLGKRYHIDNAAVLGALFIPSGVGNIIGAAAAGKLSDIVVMRCRAKRQGIWVPEDRLKVTLVGALILTPLSILCVGLIVTYIDGVPGIALCLICLFMNGLGTDFVLSPSAAYYVDILHSRSAEVSAASMALRGSILSLCTSVVLPLVESLGVLTTYSIVALLCWTGFVLLSLVIRYGDKMRAYVDVGYSIIDSH